ncbi:LacI family DNA-binding transcriptional regulator [Pandoraea nosoerga]|uniref:LacI family transcriptional regulator n=1 Tax=Pandoraea nosoerga TaxID=2508296 RepID=A0A5E4U381_9BURK|nr:MULTISPECIES: LacI family DNA-binding transcriptional regulator [Pandoraea]MBN4668118.1 LacI family DNA-binding transcriptional regulator [Pandoraea nosoerga]MBN4677935.1 LacI family DNA-binding transcriptional regulator [Pandoraea nosoerga]MBN4683145.1 LacI family DNA-binding transcriptional regulator [Pandoraea nosoerga]MBN4747085.1 LacI family DNA-binding transcriptional regulator [Pandoraea nosoerga]VVD94023.1 LacI family transcriptional regulator [Pandoraea nosoerga]
MADIRDVAQRAGCSIATVSRALNSPQLVRPETLARVQAAAAELKFRPNALGRQLRGERTGLIGVMLPTLGNPVFADCLEGIEAAIDGTGHRLLLVTTQYDPERERNAIETLLQQRVDGLLLTLADAEHSALVDDLSAEGVACQLVYNDAPLRPCVSVDNRAAAAQGVAMLIEAGHRDIVMVTGALHASDRAKRRYLGYGDAMRAAGLTPLPAFEIDFNSGARGERVREWLAQRERDGARPTALFCSNDLLALGVMRALREAGLRVPDDISVLGFDGLAVGELLSPTLATVVQPSVDIGRHAAQRLLAQIDGRAGAVGAVGAASAAGMRDAALGQALILPHEIRRGGTVAAPPRRAAVRG